MAARNTVTAFINATVLDGSPDMRPQPNMAVIVAGTKIARIEPAAIAQIPSGARVVDLDGAYLMPGLINMHVHLCGSGKPVSAGDAGALMRRLDNGPGRAVVRRVLLKSAQTQLMSCLLYTSRCV